MSTDDLQFATPEPINPVAANRTAPVQTCAGCKRPITSTYFALRDKVICPDCAAQVNAPLPGSSAVRVFKAGFMGLGAGLVGALIWFAIRRVAHVEVGLVAVLVGFMVGKSVRKGSGGRGGLGYQVMAVLLTYCCIAANYMPDVVEAVIDKAHQHRTTANSATGGKTVWKSHAATSAPPTDSDQSSGKKAGPAKFIVGIILLAGLVFVVALATPILAGMNNIIGIIIIGIALWEAWKFNKPRSLAITGPYQVGVPRTARVIV